MPRYPQRANNDDEIADERSVWSEPEYKGNIRLKCRIVNETKYTFHWDDFRLQENTVFIGNGPWFNDIKTEIRPGEFWDLQAIAHRLSRMSGVELWIFYTTDVGKLDFHFNVPYVSSNSYHTERLPEQFMSIHNSAEEKCQHQGHPWFECPHNSGPGRKISGDSPDFQWTIRQRPEKVFDHFYTVDPTGELAPQVGYKHEGIAGYVYPTSVGNSVPFHRFYCAETGDHFYSQSSDAEGSTAYKFEKIECYLPASGDSGAVPLHRWSGNREHFYTTHPEGEIAAQVGYQKEGDAGFIFPNQTPGTVPLYRWFLNRD